MKKKFFRIPTYGLNVDITLLFIRLVFGYVFIIHGWGKIQNPFHWMGGESQVPSLFQALAALSEFGGGVAIILGLLTRLSAFGLSCTMIVAIFTHIFVYGNPFMSRDGGSYELPFIYLLLSVLFLLIGPGKFSLDKKIFG